MVIQAGLAQIDIMHSKNNVSYDITNNNELTAINMKDVAIYVIYKV